MKFLEIFAILVAFGYSEGILKNFSLSWVLNLLFLSDISWIWDNTASISLRCCFRVPNSWRFTTVQTLWRIGYFKIDNFNIRILCFQHGQYNSLHWSSHNKRCHWRVSVDHVHARNHYFSPSLICRQSTDKRRCSRENSNTDRVLQSRRKSRLPSNWSIRVV